MKTTGSLLGLILVLGFAGAACTRAPMVETADGGASVEAAQTAPDLVDAGSSEKPTPDAGAAEVTATESAPDAGAGVVAEATGSADAGAPPVVPVEGPVATVVSYAVVGSLDLGFKTVQDSTLGKAILAPNGAVWSEVLAVRENSTFDSYLGGVSLAERTCRKVGARLPSTADFLFLMDFFEQNEQRGFTKKSRAQFESIMPTAKSKRLWGSDRMTTRGGIEYASAFKAYSGAIENESAIEALSVVCIK